MSVELNFWKYRSGLYLDNAMVYQKACCDNEQVEGLEHLPIDAILKETAAAFHEWNSFDPFNYEGKGLGSFQISTSSQAVRFDCYSMEQADMKRFSSILSKFGCPLYDPQQGVRGVFMPTCRTTPFIFPVFSWRRRPSMSIRKPITALIILE